MSQTTNVTEPARDHLRADGQDNRQAQTEQDLVGGHLGGSEGTLLTSW
jgi:hypothetical protein